MSQQGRIEKICTKCSMKIWWNREDTTMKNTGSWYGVNGLIHNAGNCAKVKNESPQLVDTQPKIPYKMRVLESTAVNPINGKIDLLFDYAYLVEEKAKGTQYEGNHQAKGMFLKLLLDSMK